MSKLEGIGMFVVGAAMGAAITWRFIKQKYERIAQEEIDSVKSVYGKKSKSSPVFNDACKKAAEAMDGFRAVIGKENYLADSDIEKLLDDDESDKPYVISPDEFGEDDEYETISLCYYADGVLTDDHDEPIDNVDEIVGTESLTRFGEYEDDSVFVRNNRLKTDFEILLDHRPYSEASKTKPHRKEA